MSSTDFPVAKLRCGGAVRLVAIAACAAMLGGCYTAHEVTESVPMDLPEVRSLLSAAGVPPQAVAVRPHRTSDPTKLATLRLHYPRVHADAGPCGMWPQDLGPTYDREHYENREYWNLGCASQRNMAAMVENPADLVQPRGETPPYTGRRTTVLDKYHRGESSATVYPDKDQGKISDVGK